MELKIKYMRRKFNRSICSTCQYMSFCEITTDKSSITMCSEYDHYLDEVKTYDKRSGNYKNVENQTQLV